MIAVSQGTQGRSRCAAALPRRCGESRREKLVDHTYGSLEIVAQSKS